MVTPTRKVSKKKPGSLPSLPPAAAAPGAAVARRIPPRGVVASLFTKLKALSERGGALIGDAYATTAGSLLERVEQLEDAAAERRYSRRVRAATTGVAVTSAPRSRSQDSLAPAASA